MAETVKCKICKKGEAKTYSQKLLNFCPPCYKAQMDIIQPDITKAMEGLTAFRKVQILKSLFDEYKEKKKALRKISADEKEQILMEHIQRKEKAS